MTSGTPIQKISNVWLMSGGFDRSTFEPATVPDREADDQDEDQRGEERGDRELEERERVHLPRVGRCLVGEEREIPHDLSLSS